MIHLLNKKYLIVLPEGAYWIEMNSPFKDELVYAIGEKDDYTLKLYPGDWQILFTRDTQTEEGWKGVVGYPIGYDSYTQSGHSLLKSKNIDPVSNWVIIEKI